MQISVYAPSTLFDLGSWDREEWDYTIRSYGAEYQRNLCDDTIIGFMKDFDTQSHNTVWAPLILVHHRTTEPVFFILNRGAIFDRIPLIND